MSGWKRGSLSAIEIFQLEENGVSANLDRKAFLHAIWDKHPDGSWLFLAAKQGPRWIENPIKNDEKNKRNVSVSTPE